MVTRKAKFSIEIEKLKINFEGTQELGQQIQQGVTQAIGGFMNTQARLLSAKPEPTPVIDAEVSDNGSPKANGQGNFDGNSEKPKQPKQRKTKGVSLIGLLRGLKKEGFFAQARPVSEILERLQTKGHSNFTDSNISARLQDLTKKDELFRDRIGEGPYVYKDTRFHEAPRPASSPEQPAE